MDLLGSEIFRNAFVAGTLVALVTAPVGYFIVLRAQAFAGEALTDVGFAGATGAALLGWGSIVGMVSLSVLAAVGLGALSERMRGRDVEVGMVLSFALGLGVLFLSIYARTSGLHASSGVDILFGSLLSITKSELLVAGASAVAIAIALGAVYRPLLFASVDPAVAQARGVPTRLLSMVFMLILGLTAASCMLVVGVLLVSALLFAPAAAALNVTRSPRSSLGTSVAISVGAVWSGLTLAFLPGARVHLPVGFTISAIVALAYLASALARRRDSGRRPPEPPHPSREVA